MTKPDEWGSLDSIAPYYNQTIEYLQKKLSMVQEALKDTDGMTDEQIQNLVDEYNDIAIAISDAQKQLLEDTTNYQDNQFNAVVDWIEEYKSNIEDLKDDVQDYYDDLIDDLQDEADARQDNIDLIELQQNLLNAQKEKERVYREGRKCPKTTISVKSQEQLRPRKDFIVKKDVILV